MIVWLLPVDAEELVEKSWEILVVIVPASSVVKTKLGVVLFDGVVIAVTWVKFGAVLSPLPEKPAKELVTNKLDQE